jgi:hypothetical protein
LHNDFILAILHNANCHDLPGTAAATVTKPPRKRKERSIKKEIVDAADGAADASKGPPSPAETSPRPAKVVLWFLFKRLKMSRNKSPKSKSLCLLSLY